MHPLSSIQWHRVESLPRHKDPDQATTVLAGKLTAAVRAAHAELLVTSGSPPLLASLWLRAPGSRQMSFHVGGRPVFPAARGSHDEASSPLLYPPGALATSAAPASVQALVDTLPCWIRVAGGYDVLWKLDEGRALGERARSSLEDYVAHLPGPFAWLVLAEPVAVEDLQGERSAIALEMPHWRKRENSEEYRTIIERSEARYRELTKALVGGLWRVHILVGASDAPGAHGAAALLAGCSDVQDAGYVTIPEGTAADLTTTWATRGQAPLERVASPFTASSDLVATLVRPPARELPGIRLTNPFFFDVTPASASGVVEMGQILDLDERAVGPFRVSQETLNRHTFLCGATGSGKSQTARGLLESLWRETRTPWLAVEPAKSEYARMGGRLGLEAGIIVITPGDTSAPPASLNPLEPEPGYSLQSHADLVRALFLAAFEAAEPFPQVLSQALTRCYKRSGWDLVTGEQLMPVKPKHRADAEDEFVVGRYPTLSELQSTARAVVDDIGYGKEVASDVRGFVDVRIGSLCNGTPGRFFQGGHPLDIGELLTRNVVLELDSITNDQDKAFLMGAVLIRIVEHLRVRYRKHDAKGLQHVLLIEEAHRLLKKMESGPAAAAVELFASLLAEVRAYGEGIIIVEQIPSKIIPDVIKNTALKIMHRLPAQEDRDIVGASINLTDEQSEAVVAFSPGIAAVSTDGEDRPLRVRMTPGYEREAVCHVGKDVPLRGHRSLWCGESCQVRRCTLGEINTATKLAHQPVSVVWVEAVAASLITELSLPWPRPIVLETWRQAPRTTECALAEAVERAVAARRPLLQPWFDADDFGAELLAVLTAQLNGGPGSVAEPQRWTAGLYRWREVRRILSQAVDDHGGLVVANQRPLHPLTDEWRQRGLDLGAHSLGEQYTYMVSHPAFAHDSDVVALGDVETSGLRRAVVDLAGSVGKDWYRRALTHTCFGENLLALLDETFDLLDPIARLAQEKA